MTSVALTRLRKEYARVLKEPPANIETKPLETNLLEWHYVLTGPKGTVFEGGKYHGKIQFPNEYPYKPPGIFMFTPNGCFDPAVKVCLSMSDYHPETWNPLWSVSRYVSCVVCFSLYFARQSTMVCSAICFSGAHTSLHRIVSLLTSAIPPLFSFPFFYSFLPSLLQHPDRPPLFHAGARPYDPQHQGECRREAVARQAIARIQPQEPPLPHAISPLHPRERGRHDWTNSEWRYS